MVLFGLAAQERGPGRSRVGITASRKVGGAVVRNRCRRRFRELFRLYFSDSGGAPVDLVMNARRGCAEAEWSDLRREFQRCLKIIRGQLGSR